MVICGYCNEEIERVPPYIFGENYYVSSNPKEPPIVVCLHTHKYHLECWVRKKWIEKGWIEENYDEGRVEFR